MSVSYPLFRKYKNDKSFFKIISPEEFEEIVILPKSNQLHYFKAKILPDRNHIYDLTHNYEHFADKITEQEYEKVKSNSSPSK